MAEEKNLVIDDSAKLFEGAENDKDYLLGKGSWRRRGPETTCKESFRLPCLTVAKLLAIPTKRQEARECHLGCSRGVPSRVPSGLPWHDIRWSRRDPR